MFKEFKTFAMQGNMVDLAIGVIIGAAFGKIITSLVDDIIMPPIGMLLGGVNFSTFAFKLKEGVTINYGAFIQHCIDFTIIAFCIFLLIKVINKYKSGLLAQAPPPTPSELLLAEIRDSLKK